MSDPDLPTSERELPPPGWYPDPLHNKRERYWDGQAWEQNEHTSALVPAGYITAVVLPIVGLVLGIVAGTRPDAAVRRHGPYIVIVSIVAAIVWFSFSAQVAHADTRASVIERYATEYGADQGWVLIQSPTFAHGDFRRSYYTMRFLGNPAPGAQNCFGDIVTVDMPGCPTKFFQDDGPFWIDVEARAAKCGPGWYVVSTPYDLNTCRITRLPGWNDFNRLG